MNKIPNYGRFIIGIIGIVLLWILGSHILPDSIPGIVTVLFSIIENFGTTHIPNIFITGITAILGLSISVMLSFLLVYIIAVRPYTESIFSPLLILMKATPVVAFIPLIITLFGTNILAKVICATTVSFFPLIIGGIDGIKRVPNKLIILSKVYCSSPTKTFSQISYPIIIESMLSSLKVATPLSLVGAMVGEFLIGGDNCGLGCFLASNLTGYVIVSRYSAMVLTALLGMTFYGFAYIIHQKFEKSINLNK